MKKVLIIGGVAGGASAAARLRRLDETAEIIMFERGEHISFANCGLPYYIGGIIPERDHLLVETAEGMSSRFNMDVRVQTEVLSIHTSRKTVSVLDRITGRTYEESYDYIILSPGANPITPPIPGLDEAENVFTLRSIPDTDRIMEFIEIQQPHKAVVVGGGFIGLEMAENLHHRGLDVTIVEMLDQVMAPLDYEMAAFVHNHLREKGVNLILGDGVQAFKELGGKIQLQSGKTVASEMTILSIGVRPEVSLAKEAGLELGPRGGIKVNPYLQTSDPFIYAIGDAVEVQDFISQKPALIPLAGPANKQGRMAADNIAGLGRKYRGTMGTSIAKVFDLQVASVGNNEKMLKQNDMPYEVVHIHSGSHAGYYPGAHDMALKLLFHPTTGQIYGAQGVGQEGVDKRIDVLATAIFSGLTVRDLQELELAYAPPFSSAKDPVNMLGFAAANIMDGITNHVQWYEIEEIKKEGGILLDIRSNMERKLDPIDDSIHIPLDELRTRLSELPLDKGIYVFCYIGVRGYIAERILKQNGFSAYNLDGGIRTLRAVQGGSSMGKADDRGFQIID
ncbi:MAG: CoA-disulfide reductase [Firmicutes bacterium]|nr:CoA-disulfide reductase [Bacillota bacterium]